MTTSRSTPKRKARAAKRKLTPRQRVLKKYPTALMNTAGYIQVNGKRGDWATVIGRSWADAARSLK